ncbi:MAG TPA: hypothetical protein VJ777_13485 [Mycobacterium sp.]|nr:hypothetical protein [Mycobacterium sp.]
MIAVDVAQEPVGDPLEWLGYIFAIVGHGLLIANLADAEHEQQYYTRSFG